MGKKSVIFGIIAVLLVLAGLGWSYFQLKVEILRIAVLSTTLLVLVVGIIILAAITSKKGQLRRVLKELETTLPWNPTESLKGKYVQAYNLYLKLSEKNKQNFYGRLTKLREKMEEQLKAEKRVEDLLQKSSVRNIPLLQKQYDEMYRYFRKLPASVQQKYYPQIMHVKEVLEKGR